MTAWLVLSWLAGVLLIADQRRRPDATWAAADRDRSWWVFTTGLCSLIGLGVVWALVYAVVVLPCFTADDGVADAFRKRP